MRHAPWHQPLKTSGVALAATSVLVVPPAVEAQPNDVLAARKVTTAEVAPVAFVNPIETWIDVLETAAANLQEIEMAIAEDPAPIFAKLATNQIADAEYLAAEVPVAVEAAVGDIVAGDVVKAVEALLAPANAIVDNTWANFTAALDVMPSIVLDSLLSALGGGIANGAAAYVQIQDTLDALQAGDYVTLISDVLNAPALVTGAQLNGYLLQPMDFDDITVTLPSSLPVVGDWEVLDMSIIGTLGFPGALAGPKSTVDLDGTVCPHCEIDIPVHTPWKTYQLPGRPTTSTFRFHRLTSKPK